MFCLEGFKILTTMFGLSIAKKQTRNHKYYKCTRCGYISIVRNTECPICVKDGFNLKMREV